MFTPLIVLEPIHEDGINAKLWVDITSGIVFTKVTPLIVTPEVLGMFTLKDAAQSQLLVLVGVGVFLVGVGVGVVLVLVGVGVGVGVVKFCKQSAAFIVLTIFCCG